MLPSPVLFYKMDELNSVNSGTSVQYDESVILNCVRNRKKVSELPNCPVCSCTIRQGELESHLALEVERLQKISSGATKRKLSANGQSPQGLAVPGPSTDPDEDIDLSGFTGSDVYQRVHENRVRRLRARRRSPGAGAAAGAEADAEASCPVCDARVPVARIQRHALRCLRRTGAALDDDPLPDTSSEGSIDVENDEPEDEAGGGGGFGVEYQWCGQWRVRATALQQRQQAPPHAAAAQRRVSQDQALVVDGDEDAELYGPPQYSPSRIAPDAEIGGAAEEPEPESTDGQEGCAGHARAAPAECASNGLVQASAETRIQALKAKINELERKQNSAFEAKCLICLGPYTSPVVSIQCWHVYCEVCWLQSLRAKKICPQCNAITTAAHLRRVYI